MSFADDLEKASASVIAETDQHRKFITLALFNSVIRDTPVDEGRARGNWQCTIASPAATETNNIDKTPKGQDGGITQQEAEQVTLNSLPEQTIYLTNNLPYIERLEFGHSKIQAPEGMLRKNMARIQQIVRETQSKK